MSDIKSSLDSNKYTDMNLYFQDEARFGLMTHIGSMITARGVAPIVNFRQEFKNTYLYGSYSPIDGDSVVCEIDCVTGKAFEAYLKELSRHKPNQYKIVVIDNARFHSTQNITVPDNIKLINIPPYSPELNPCEQVWRYIKDRFKNKSFSEMKDIKKWLHEFVGNMSEELIKSIVSNHHYLNAYIRNS